LNLKDKLKKLLARQQEILDGAKTAQRELAPGEQLEFDALQRDIDTVKAAIEEEERSAAAGAEAQRAILAERQRVSEIGALCREFDVDPKDYIENGSTMDEVRAAVLEAVRTRMTPIPGSNARIETEEADKIREAASDAIILRAGRTIETPAPGATEMRGMRLRDLAVDCLTRAGVTNAYRLEDDELYRRALTPDSQFAGVLSATVNKSMSTAYRAAQTTYERWTSRGSNPDFKGATHYQISEAGALVQMTQSGEFKFDEMQDQGVNKAIATFGRSFGLTRQALINDDLGMLTRVPEAYVRAAKRGINALVYQMLCTNPVIFDGNQLFDAANHNNFTAQAAAISVAAVGAGRTAMRRQTNLRGLETLNIGPRFLIVPASIETVAQQFVSPALVPTAQNVINPFVGTLEVVADAEIDGYDLNDWYLAADPGDIDTIEVTYLNGSDMPKLESQVAFDYLGMRWRIYIDYGVTILDYRGLYKQTGA
jgi:hypothetical protein